MIRLIIPDITFDMVVKDFKKIFRTGIMTQGNYVKEFERAVAQYIGVKYAFATTSATTALHLSLVALGISAGDEVLVSDFTFPATANVVAQCGATPVLVDIDLDTLNIDLEDLERKITKKTKAILPVDAFGRPLNMRAIMKIARRHNLPVIEDAACAIGAKYAGELSGSVGTAGCFSFHPRKSITTGEGGMITTNNHEVAERITTLRSHGGIFDATKGYYRYESAGFNYRMTEMQAAMGVVQMKKIDRIINTKIKLAKTLMRKLSPGTLYKLPQINKLEKHIFQSFVILLNNNIDRNSIIRRLKKNGIETTLGTYALHAQTYFMKKFGYRPGQLPNSYTAFNQTLTLPLYNSMTINQMDFIVGRLNEALN